ncbi:UDP-glucose 4-epimerase [Rhodovulum sp. PH10]|uniref:NAD-dependent epimerase/dehydratase family protein n=1 Tax=Rhodovulum sp. PH10 TaxID=1187851 RepID=UPI00027C20AC|nr:NAD-dependent epimerase/dehydratase family protein [Rhodovulum sp. PH10]EJW09676.1 UDP-glucose 4-epimerase [Rhodovulum sp. PH10]
MTRRILVTGASGFVGRALVPALAAAGNLVLAASRRPAETARGPGIEPVALPDLDGPVDWAPLLEGVDAVVHLAGIAHRSGIEDAVYDRVIRAGTGSLARAAARRKVSRLVLASAVAAPPRAARGPVVTEAAEPQPATAYERAKLAAEVEVRAAGVPFTVLRPPMIYGPNVKGNMALLMRIAGSPWPLPAAAFTTRRSLLALDNLIAAIVFCLDQPATVGETYLVADPEPITLAEMITILREAAARPTRGGGSPAPFEILLRMSERNVLWERIGDDLVVDPGKLIAAGWRPVVDTRTALRAMVRANGADERDEG